MVNTEYVTDTKGTAIRVDDVLAVAKSLAPADRLRLIERLWDSLPPETWPAPNMDDHAAATRQLMDGNVNWSEPVPWPVVQRMIAESVRRSRPKVYSAPRRFDLATIFIVTVAYSMMFAGMSVFGLPAGVSLSVAGFITVVGLGQAMLFRGEKPRLASAVVGLVTFSLGVLGFWIVGGRRMYGANTIVFSSIATVIGGALYGYLAGACVGAVFMLADFLRRSMRFAFGRRTATVEQGPSDG